MLVAEGRLPHVLSRSFAEALIAELHRLVQLLGVVPGARNRARMVSAWVALTLKQRAGIWPALTRRVTWIGTRGEELHATVGDPSELRVIRELFVLEEYALPGLEDPDVIVDLGSNVGISVLYFKSRFPSARVVAAEPLPEALRRLRANTDHLDGVEVVAAAVSSEDGPLRLYSGDESWAASTFSGNGRGTTVEVEGLTLDRLVADRGLERIDLLKMDVEGAEEAVLSTTGALDRIGSIVFEFHAEHAGDSLWSLLERLPGYELLHLQGDSGVHPLVTLRRRSTSAADPDPGHG